MDSYRYKCCPLWVRFILSLVLALPILAACQSVSTREAIARQLALHPESRVQDIYKSFCQDNLGPAHLIPNPETARNYLQSELAAYRADVDSGKYPIPVRRFEPVGDKGNYVRVDLSVVLDSLVSEDTLLDAFVRSASSGRKMTPEQWRKKWLKVAAVIRHDFPDIPECEKDLRQIDSLMAEGHYILHHSPAFNAACHPHYRIIARPVFETIFPQVNMTKLMNCRKDTDSTDKPAKDWQEIAPEEIDLNPIQMIDKDWLAVSAGKEGNMNLMTISWGTIGELWSKPVFIVYVSTSRYTYRFMEENDYFTVTHFPASMKAKLGYLGRVSGRDEDKVAGAGLTVEFTELGNPVYAEADLAIECRKLDAQPFDANLLPAAQRAWYGQSGIGIHHMYIGEIIHVWKK